MKNLGLTIVLISLFGCISGQPAETFEVTVICEFTAAIEAGNYDRVNPYVTEEFALLSSCVSGPVDVTLFHINREDVSSDEVISIMSKEGYRPATLWELAALGAAYPDLQREFYVVALGSIWYFKGVKRDVPILFEYVGHRQLSMYSYAFDWNSQGRPADRFAAVRKS